MPRVLAVGLDSADVGLVDQLLDQGRMPVLAKLTRTGTRVAIDSPHYASGLVWEDLVTGGQGRPQSIGFEPDRYVAYQRGAPRVPAFWGSLGRDAVVFDVPSVNLWTAGEATVVTGWGEHASLFPPAANPPGLLTEILQRFGPAPARGMHGGNRLDPDDIARFRAAAVDSIERRARAATWLHARQPDARLFLTVIAEPHPVAEAYWHAVDPTHPLATHPTVPAARAALEATYEAADRALATMVDAMAPDVVVVFSPQGMTTNTGDLPGQVILPELLHRLGGGEPWLPGARDPDAWLTDGAPPLPWGQLPSPHVRQGRRTAARARRMARAVAARVPRRRRDSTGARPVVAETPRSRWPVDEPILQPDWQVAAGYADRWPRSTWFALPTYADGLLRINVAGREADGVVAPADFLTVRERIGDELRACVDLRTQQPAVAEVEPTREDPMDGEHPADLVVRFRPHVDAVRHPGVGVVGPFGFRRTGSHRSEGFLVTSQPRRTDTRGPLVARDLAGLLLRLAGGSSAAGSIPGAGTAGRGEG